MRTVLFICSGNYYRSRFAEAMFNFVAEQRNLEWQAVSRGLATHLVFGAGDLSIYTRHTLVARGIPLHHTSARPTQLVEDDLRRADRAIALKEAEHRSMMRDKFPAWEDCIEYWNVHDLDGATPDAALPGLERLVMRVIEEVSDPANAETPAKGGDDEA